MKLFKLKGWKYKFSLVVAKVPDNRFAVDLFVSGKDRISLYGKKEEILEKIDEIERILQMAKEYISK